MNYTVENYGIGIEIYDGDSLMEESAKPEQAEDPFVAFVEYAKTVLCSAADANEEGRLEIGGEASSPGWGWIASRILKTCIAYSSGVTEAILLSDLAQAWDEQQRTGVSKKRPECIDRLKKKHRRTKLAHTVTIDSIYEKKFLSLNSVLEAVVVDAFPLPGTNIHMLTLGDFWSSNTIDLYLHRRYYNLVDFENGVLKKGREVFLTGCYLRTAAEGTGRPRLLPSEYLVVLLDEDQDDDAMLLGAQFFSDSFSCISLDAANQGISYSLYTRIESIGDLDTQGKFRNIPRKQVTVVDNDGARLDLYLWGDQVVLANLFSVGSMLAIDRPYIASSLDGAMELCLEYGSATQLYLVPHIDHEEQICVPLTQNRYQGSRMMAMSGPTQDLKISQVSLRCDSQGTIDFSAFPFRSFIVDLRDKMTGICLYGIVKDIFREGNNQKVVFSLRFQDNTGAIWAKLHFTKSWSLGRLGHGHSVYISGLTCSMTPQKRLEVSWVENDSGTSFVNMSCLPALLTSSCLQKLSCLSDLPAEQSSTHQICRVWPDHIDHCDVIIHMVHAACGHFVEEMADGFAECSFCHQSCEHEVIRCFHLKITLADESAKIFAWCNGHTATELLQISPDDFVELPEEEQIMYPSSLEHEKFTVALVYCKTDVDGPKLSIDGDKFDWEITRALKYEQ
uniref:Nucleic acid-binding protein n=1 Tax=Kalanchoe fedtschenkoi TaxID=63787 RepID=A0A7N0UF69_KALFE